METKYMENDDNVSSSSKPVAEELKTVKAEHEDGNENGQGSGFFAITYCSNSMHICLYCFFFYTMLNLQEYLYILIYIVNVVHTLK